ncbi:MAG: type I-U CRISPR-associated RAMP protein Csb1/Cas7u [bacterium]
MPLDLSALDSASRLFVEADLQVATGGGGRFQPTGFPDLGPALYRGADGANWLLIESPQSMANRLERVCWVDGNEETDRVGSYNADCQGIPYVLATDSDGRPLTASTLEAHRLSSPYIWNTQPFTDPDDAGKELTIADYLRRLFGLTENRLVPWKKVAEGLLKVDPGCLLHGIWFNEALFGGGKVRITRALSGYIEAREPSAVNFGFQKRDSVSDRTDREAGHSAAEGYGSVIGPKQHFTSPEIKAYFQVDLERLRSYGLSAALVRALAAWAIYKIRRVLVASRDGVADLRTECKFATSNVSASLVDNKTGRTSSYALPELDDELVAAFKELKHSRAPIKVRWVPNIEGKAELPEGVLESKVVRTGFEARTKFETQKPKKGKDQSGRQPKRFFVVFGEWTTSDKERLRALNAEDPAKAIVEKAIKDYEEKWAAKAQSRKTDEMEDQEDGEGKA